MTRLSIIMPTLNEASVIPAALAAVQPLRVMGHEVIVVDGSSVDATVELAADCADRVLTAPRGRALQMNAGARVARGDVLWFLHADTLAPPGAGALILDGLVYTGRRWGRFDAQLSGSNPLLRVVERLMNWRSRLTGIATGDQGLFVERTLFESLGGFPGIEVMEDIALSRMLKRHGPPLCLAARVLTSSRRWERHGVVRTILLMWGLRLAWFLGVRPALLARWYR